MLSTLFRNLQNHTVVNGGVEFVEDEVISFLEALDFATSRTKTCVKGYSCGKSCISPTKNCRNPLEGQAKNYAEFLKSTQSPKETPVNLADFESVKVLGEKIVNKYLLPNEEFIKKRDELRQRKQDLSEELDRLNKDVNTPNEVLDKAIDAFFEVQNELIRKEEAIAVEQGAKFDQLRQDLIKFGGIDKSGAEFWYDHALNKQTKVAKKAATALQDVYRLTGGQIGTLGSVGKTESRAFARKPRGNEMGFINVGKTANPSVVFHEVGHHFEYSHPELVESANAFIVKRSAGRSPQQLSVLTGVKQYKKDEIALPDEFLDPYVGKLYKDRSTEVISMGLERFTSGHDMHKFREKDPEHFHYILGVLAHVNKFKT